MNGPHDAKRTLTVAGLVAMGLFAGFLVATTASGEEYATVASVAGANRAYGLLLDEQRVRFALEPEPGTTRAPAPQATASADGADATDATDATDAAPVRGQVTKAGTGTVRFALYDPDNVLFGYFELAGEGDTVDVIADRPGYWVVFVTQARDARLAVQFEADVETGSADDVLVPIPVQEERLLVAEQGGGRLDTQFAARVPVRPAIAFLDYWGTARSLDAVVTTEAGTVYEVHDRVANITSGRVAAYDGRHVADPSNLRSGTYQVFAEAERFDGRLELVYQTYDRSRLDRLAGERLTANGLVTSSAQLRERGTVVAEAGEFEAHVLDTGRARSLVFFAEEDTSARVFVFDHKDRVVALVDVGKRSSTVWDWDRSDDEDEDEGEDGDGAADNATELVSVQLALQRAGEYVIFVDDVYGRSDVVGVLVPGVFDAPPARELEIIEREVRLAGPNPLDGTDAVETIQLDGGLVRVGLTSWDVVGLGREVKVTGPRGVVLVHSQGVNAAGFAAESQGQVFPERFSGGEHVLETSGDGAAGDVTVRFYTYHA